MPRKFVPNNDIPVIEITLSGNSIPEDANEFYFPFLDALDRLVSTELKFVFNFKFDYYNTASTRYISTILGILKPLAQSKRVTINWYYLSIDEDMKELGEDYIETIRIKMNLIKR